MDTRHAVASERALESHVDRTRRCISTDDEDLDHSPSSTHSEDGRVGPGVDFDGPRAGEILLSYLVLRLVRRILCRSDKFAMSARTIDAIFEVTHFVSYSSICETVKVDLWKRNPVSEVRRAKESHKQFTEDPLTVAKTPSRYSRPSYCQYGKKEAQWIG
jgi:hypothetical protein